MNKKLVLGSIAVVIATFAGCGTKEAPKDAVVDTTKTSASNTNQPPANNASSTGVKPADVIAKNPLTDPANILSKRIVYFDYDKDTLKPEFQALVQAHAKFLADNRGRKIRLEGHTDERGSREYNMALGQRRADAVRKASNLLGVSNDRMETISFGEDKPRAQGHDESAWAQNRRVEIVYDGE